MWTYILLQFNACTGGGKGEEKTINTPQNATDTHAYLLRLNSLLGELLRQCYMTEPHHQNTNTNNIQGG